MILYRKIKGYAQHISLRLYVIYTIKMWTVEENIEYTIKDFKKYFRFND